MDFYEPPGDPGDLGDQYNDQKNQAKRLEDRNIERKKEIGAKPADNKEKEETASMHEDKDNNDDDDRTSIQFVYNNDETQETWSQPNTMDVEAQSD